jgi:DNA-binding CsgD family transcriptional regulator/PAS domain-containing protein
MFKPPVFSVQGSREPRTALVRQEKILELAPRQDPSVSLEQTPHDEQKLRRAETSDIYEALNTTLRWRTALTLAVSQKDGSLVASNRTSADTDLALAVHAAPSRPIEFGGLPVHLVTESLTGLDPAREIPSIVTDGMLRSIVEAHFAVWYVWHVPTGTIVAPGMSELLRIPQSEVPTIVEQWIARVHPEDLPRMVVENDEALLNNSAFRSEYRFRQGDGKYISISDWGIVLSGEDGSAEWMAGGLRDITIEKNLEQAREESAQLREVLFKRALVPTFLIDGNGVLVDASQSALDYLEAQRETLVGRQAVDILSARLVNSAGSSVPLKDGHGTVEVELDAAGTRKWLLATVVPFFVGEEQMAFVLGTDVTEQRRATDALAHSEASLREKTEALERHNVALRVLMDQRRDDFDEQRRVLTENIEQLVFPTLDRLASVFSDREEVALLDVLRQTLSVIANPMLENRDSPLDGAQGLSRREYEILQLVRAGKTTREIAGALYLSPTTVTFHRGNIRRKLGLHRSGLRLTPRVTVDAMLDPQSEREAT